jgi:hypothetical protein
MRQALGYGEGVAFQENSMKRLMVLMLVVAGAGILSGCCDCDKKGLSWGPGPMPWTESGTMMGAPMSAK